MTTIAVTCPPGTRGATTTAAALALTWSGAVVLAEMDPSAGDLAAWWDLTESPGIGTAVTDIHRPDWITANTQQAASGVLVMPAPLRAREASGAVGEATRSVLPALCAYRDVTVLIDTGRSTHVPAAATAGATVVVIVAAQIPDAPRATAAILERTGDLADTFASNAVDAVVAIIGTDPYPLGAIENYVGTTCHAVADDPLGAAVIAGRPATGRLATRSKLIRSIAPLASELAEQIDRATESRR